MKSLPDRTTRNVWDVAIQGTMAMLNPQVYLANRQLEAAELRIIFEGQREEDRQRFELRRIEAQALKQSEIQEKLQRVNQDFQLEIHEAGRKHQLEMQSINLQAQREQMQRQFENSLKIANLNHENLMEVERFRDRCARLSFKERQELEWEFKQFDRQTQIRLADKHRQSMLQSAEYSRILDRHPLTTLSTPTLDFYESYRSTYGVVPPLVIIANPRASIIEDKLREFLQANYSLTRSERPAKIQFGSWRETSKLDESSLDLLFFTHKSVPTLIFGNKVVGNDLKIQVVWWNSMATAYEYPLLSMSIPWRAIQRDIVKAHALDWEQRKVTLQAKGNTSEEIRQEGGTDEINLQILKLEEEDEHKGRIKPREYNMNDEKYGRELTELLASLQNLLASLILDEYYLFHYNVRPLLPKLLPSLLAAVPEEVMMELIGVIVERYKSLCQAVESDRPSWVADIAVELAEGLSGLSDKSFSREMLNYSIQYRSRL